MTRVKDAERRGCQLGAMQNLSVGPILRAREAFLRAREAFDNRCSGVRWERAAAVDRAAKGSTGPFAGRALDVIAAFQTWPMAWRLGIAIAVVVTAVAIRLTLLAPLGTRLAYVTLYPAITVAALVGGFYGGFLATICAAVLAHLLLAPLEDAADWLGLATFLVSGFLISGMAEVLRLAGSRLAESEAIKQHELKLRLFVEQAPAAIAMMDNEMRYIAASARWKSDYRVEEDIIGRSHYDVFPETPERWKSFHARALAGEVLQAQEDAFERRDGSVQWLRWEVRPWSRASGDIGGIIIFSEDITERKRAQLALSESQVRYRAIVDTALDSIVVIDENGVIRSVNPATQSMFGYAQEELVGQNVKILMPPEEAEAHDSHIESFVRTGIRKIIGIGREVAGCRKDGSIFPVDLAVAEWRDTQGHRFFTGTMRDMADRKRVEEALATARRLDAVGQLAGGMAHDFNNLLAVIGGNLELIEQRVNDDDVRQLVRRALEATEAGASFNRKLLSLARRRKLEPQYIILNARITETMKLLERTLGENIEIATELAADLWSALADPGEIDSALLNIAVNARDAMPGGGTLRVETANVSFDDKRASKFPDARAGEYVRLSVIDTGTGMPQDILRRAIEPFFTTKEPGKGTGLGLSSIHSFAKQSGGFITLASEQGKGTTVSLFLPRAVSEAIARRAATNRDQAPRGDGEVVLVVEDDDQVREVTLKRLEALGYVVTEARTAPEAIERLEADASIDLVLSDVVMPGGMTGYDLAEWVSSAKPRVKVVLASGYDRSGGGRESNLKIPMLGKPYTREQLARTMREALDGPPAQMGHTSPVNT